MEVTGASVGWSLAALVSGAILVLLVAVGGLRRDTRPYLVALALWVAWDVAFALDAFDTSTPDVWGRVSDYFALTQPLALLCFGLVWPRPVLGMPRWAITGGCVALALGLVAWRMARPADFDVEAGGWAGLAFVAVFILNVVPALRWFRAHAAGSGTEATLLLGLAYGAYLAGAMAGPVLNVLWPAPGADAPDQVTRAVAAVAGLSLFVVAAAVVAWSRATRDRRSVRRVLAVLAAFVLGRIVMFAFERTAAAPDRFVAYDVVGDLAISLMVGYALLRMRLFDLDLKIKWTLRRGTVAAVFLAVFFVVAQIAQNVLTDSQGLVVGGVAAGLMLFAIHPLQRAAERVADAALPGVKDTPEFRASRKHEVYRSALRLAFADRALSREEERHLADLATELDIAAADAFRLREDVERELGVHTA